MCPYLVGEISVHFVMFAISKQNGEGKENNRKGIQRLRNLNRHEQQERKRV